MATDPPVKPYVWRYLPEGQVRHALTRDMLSQQEQSSMCGVTPLWLLPKSALWQNDMETLKQRRPCLNCVTLLKDRGYEK